MAVCRQTVRLGVRPLQDHDQRFLFPTELCGNSPYVTSSLTRRWVCLLWICLTFRQVYISDINRLLKSLTFALHSSPLSVQALQSRQCLTGHEPQPGLDRQTDGPSVAMWLGLGSGELREFSCEAVPSQELREVSRRIFAGHEGPKRGNLKNIHCSQPLPGNGCWRHCRLETTVICKVWRLATAP
jgi:hypothetical protein